MTIIEVLEKAQNKLGGSDQLNDYIVAGLSKKASAGNMTAQGLLDKIARPRRRRPSAPAGKTAPGKSPGGGGITSETKERVAEGIKSVRKKTMKPPVMTPGTESAAAKKTRRPKLFEQKGKQQAVEQAKKEEAKTQKAEKSKAELAEITKTRKEKEKSGEWRKTPSGKKRKGGTKAEKRQKEEAATAAKSQKAVKKKPSKKAPAGKKKAPAGKKKAPTGKDKIKELQKKPVTVGQVSAYAAEHRKFTNPFTKRKISIQTIVRGKGRSKMYQEVYEKFLIPAVKKWRDKQYEQGKEVKSRISKTQMGKGKPKSKGKGKPVAKAPGTKAKVTKEPKGKEKKPSKGKEHPLALPEAKGRKPGLLQKVKKGLGDVAKAGLKGLAKGTKAGVKGLAKGTKATMKAVQRAGKRVVEGPTVETVAKRSESRKKIKETAKKAPGKALRGLGKGIKFLTKGREVTLPEEGGNKKAHILGIPTFKEASALYPLGVGGPEVAYRMIRVAHRNPAFRSMTVRALHEMAQQRKEFTHRLASACGEEFEFCQEDLHKAAADIKDCYDLPHEDLAYLFI